MSGKWPGGFITKNAPEVVGPVDGEGGSAPGIWTLDEVADYEKQGLWPKPILDAELYSWGRNVDGQLGLGDTTNRSSPVQVGALITWGKQLATGQNHCLAVKTDGTLWAWGDNAPYGQLGLGDLPNRSSPVQVGALTTWLDVAGGYSHSLATTTGGALYAFGDNGTGALGQGNTTNRSSPVQVGALTNWSKIAGGNGFTLATTTDGKLYSWGLNTNGQLGLGYTANRSSPVQVGALTNWSDVASNGGSQFSLAIKTDGTLWSWGDNLYGQLGLNTSGVYTKQSSPVQVGALTTWSKVAAGNQHGLAIKTDGTLWSWGNNASGRLGLGNTSNYSSPVQVGALTTWAQVEAGTDFSLATTTDGKLYAFGNNSNGQLGDGTTTARNSPVQVGALTTWSTLLGAGSSFSVAITKS